jgi:hypothetical protein
MEDTVETHGVQEDRKWSSASFRIMGGMLDLGEIDAALGLRATYSHTTGERSRSNVVYRESLWSLKSPLSRAESLDKHLEWLVEKLEPKVEEVRSLSRKYRVISFVALDLPTGKAGSSLGPLCLPESPSSESR